MPQRVDTFTCNSRLSNMNLLSARTTFSCREETVLNVLRELPASEFYVSVDGGIVDVFDYAQTQPDSFFQLHFRCLGGKGGFGSLLRSFRVNKSTNQDMCRDLNGRRLGAVEKEKKIRKWLERREEREKEESEKMKQKIARLKSKPVHEYEDAEKYESERRLLEEKTETAFEDGFAEYLAKSRSKKTDDVSSDSDTDEEDMDMPGTSSFNFMKNDSKRKRKNSASPDEGSSNSSEANEVPEKKERRDESVCDMDSVESLDGSASEESRTGIVSDESKPSTTPEVVVIAPEVVEVEETDVKPEVTEVVQKEVVQEVPTGFDPIDLDEFESAAALEQLGLHHLKHALEARGLKCGGSLQERAARLLSVKGLKPENYPKTIKAAPSKKKK